MQQETDELKAAFTDALRWAAGHPPQDSSGVHDSLLDVLSRDARTSPSELGTGASSAGCGRKTDPTALSHAILGRGRSLAQIFGPVLSDELVESEWSAFVESMLATEIEFEAVVLLLGVHVERPRELVSGGWIRPATADDVLRLSAATRGHRVIGPVCAVCVRKVVPVVRSQDGRVPEPGPTPSLHEELLDLVARVRVALDRPVVEAMRFEALDDWYMGAGYSWYDLMAGPPVWPVLGTEPPLGETQLDELARLVGALDTRWPEIRVAVGRYREAQSRRNATDSVLDYSIALESLLTTDQHADNTFRFATFGALLLRASRRPEETYALLKTLYTARSRLVHGGPVATVKYGDRDVDAAFLAKQLGPVCRELILRVVAEAPFPEGVTGRRRLKPTERWLTSLLSALELEDNA